MIDWAAAASVALVSAELVVEVVVIGRSGYKRQEYNCSFREQHACGAFCCSRKLGGKLPVMRLNPAPPSDEAG